MNHAVCTILLILLTFSTIRCGDNRGSEDSDNKVFNGAAATGVNYQAIAELEGESIDKIYSCTTFKVASNAWLTAEHCADGLVKKDGNKPSLTINLDSGDSLSVNQVILHKDRQVRVFAQILPKEIDWEYDLAVLITDDTNAGGQPNLIATEFDNSAKEFVGYGYTEFDFSDTTESPYQGDDGKQVGSVASDRIHLTSDFIHYIAKIPTNIDLPETSVSLTTQNPFSEANAQSEEQSQQNASKEYDALTLRGDSGGPMIDVSSRQIVGVASFGTNNLPKAELDFEGFIEDLNHPPYNQFVKENDGVGLAGYVRLDSKLSVETLTRAIVEAGAKIPYQCCLCGGQKKLLIGRYETENICSQRNCALIPNESECGAPDVDSPNAQDEDQLEPDGQQVPDQDASAGNGDQVPDDVPQWPAVFTFNTKKVMETGCNLNIRAEPSTSAKAVGTFKSGVKPTESNYKDLGKKWWYMVDGITFNEGRKWYRIVHNDTVDNTENKGNMPNPAWVAEDFVNVDGLQTNSLGTCLFLFDFGKG